MFSLAPLGSLFTAVLLREAQKILHFWKLGNPEIGYSVGWEIENRDFPLLGNGMGCWEKNPALDWIVPRSAKFILDIDF